MKKNFEKSLSMLKKTEREDPSGFFNIHSVAKLLKIEGGPFRGEFFFEKSRTVPKKSKGGPLVSSGIVCYAGNLFGSVPWANRYILASSEFCRFFGRTILVSSGGLKKTLTKSHDYSRLFSKEKLRVKMKLTSNDYITLESNLTTPKTKLNVSLNVDSVRSDTGNDCNGCSLTKMRQIIGSSRTYTNEKGMVSKVYV